MIIIECKQGTTEWHTQRLGMITASNFKAVLSKGVGKAPSKTKETYLYKLLSERLTGLTEDGFYSADMQWGNDTEPHARANYELISGLSVKEVGFCQYDNFIGVSPDGLVSEDGLLEIKCPKTTTQIKRVEAGIVPKEYISQIQGQLWVTGRKWCDFVSFDPRLNGTNLDYFSVRVMRDEDYIKDMSEKILAFKDELILLINKYMEG